MPFDILLQEARARRKRTCCLQRTPTAYNKSDFSGGYKISATRQVNFLATLSKRCCASCKSFLDAHDSPPYNVIYPLVRFMYFLSGENYSNREMHPPSSVFDEVSNDAGSCGSILFVTASSMLIKVCVFDTRVSGMSKLASLHFRSGGDTFVIARSNENFVPDRRINVRREPKRLSPPSMKSTFTTARFPPCETSTFSTPSTEVLNKTRLVIEPQGKTSPVSRAKACSLFKLYVVMGSSGMRKYNFFPGLLCY